MRVSIHNKHLGAITVLLGAMLFGVGFLSMMPSEHSPARNDGEAIYMTRCMSCHQIDGAGIAGVFPPLNDTEWVVGDKGRVIRIVLDGMMGETEVQGVVYSGAMPPWKTFLSDEEIAAVVTYIRNAWDNEASDVTPQEVKLVREATKARTTSWTTEELEQEANQGIPGSFGFMAAPADSSGGPK
jgi:mono/diheme cytochrome c family protein